MATELCQGVNKIHKKLFDMPGAIEIVYTVIIKDFAGIAGPMHIIPVRKQWRKRGQLSQQAQILSGGRYV